MVSNGIQLERIDEELQVQLTRPQDPDRMKRLVVKVTITRTLTFTETAGTQRPSVCHADAFHMIV